MRQITLKPKPVGLVFLSVASFLVLIHSIILILFFQIEDPAVFYFLRWFDLDIEYNIPSFYSAFSIFVCAGLFLVIAVRERKSLNYQTVWWFGLAALFLFLSQDEAFKIHERIGDGVEDHFHATGLFYFPWILPYLSGLLLLGLVYSKFLWNLPKRTALQLILCGIVFVTGAAVFDMLGGREAELNGYDSATYCLLYTVEESLEMVAIAGLIYTLLTHVESRFGYLQFSFGIVANSEE